MSAASRHATPPDGGVPSEVFNVPLPEPSSPLIGRTEELGTLTALTNRERLVTITGPGGVGKTRLAVELARQLPRGSTLFVRLASVSASIDTDSTATSSQIADEIVAHAGWQRKAGQTALEILSERLASHDATLVLDNLEHLPDAPAQVTELLQACPRAHLVTTTRVALRVAGERLSRLEPLHLPTEHDETVEAAPAIPSVALMVGAAQRADRAFHLTPDNVGDVTEICRRLHGLPLALELAAARLRLTSPRQMVEWLPRQLDVLGRRRTSDEHHHTLRATIDWSYRLLDDDHQDVLARLALCPAGANAEAIAALSPGGLAVALDALDALIDHHLVQSNVSWDGDRRFTMYESIRQFGGEQADRRGIIDDVFDRLSTWMTAFVVAAAEQLPTVGGPTATARIGAETENLRAVLRWLLNPARAADLDDQRALTIVGAAWLYWWRTNQVTEAEKWLRRAITNRLWTPSSALGDALRAHADLLDETGKPHEALHALDRALALAEQLGDPALASRAQNTRGHALRRLGDLNASDAAHRAVADSSHPEVTARQRLVALNGLAANAYRRGDMHGAATHFGEIVTQLRHSGDPIALASMVSNQGAALSGAGRLEEAVVLHTEAVQLAKQAESVALTVSHLVNLASPLIRLGRLDEARAAVDEALRLNPPQDVYLRGHIYDKLSHLEALAGRLDTAGRHLVTVLDSFQQAGIYTEWSEALEHAASLAEAAGLDDTALRWMGAASAVRAAEGTTDARSHSDVDSGTEARLMARSDPAIAQQCIDIGAGWDRQRTIDAARELAGELTRVHLQRTRPGDAALRAGLTRRETEVAWLVADRLTDPEIAERLYVSRRTVTTHVSAVLRKLGLSSRRDVGAALDRLAPPST